MGQGYKCILAGIGGEERMTQYLICDFVEGFMSGTLLGMWPMAKWGGL